MSSDKDSSRIRVDKAHVRAALMDLSDAVEPDIARIIGVAYHDARLAKLIFHEANAIRHLARQPIHTIEHAVVFVGSRRISHLAKTLLAKPPGTRDVSWEGQPNKTA